jgi:hypothetical protein
LEPAERLQRRDQMLHRPGEAIEAPDEDDLTCKGDGGTGRACSGWRISKASDGPHGASFR